MYNIFTKFGDILTGRSGSQEEQEPTVDSDFGQSRAGGSAVVEDEVQETPRKRAREGRDQGREVSKKSKRTAGPDEQRLLGASVPVPKDRVTVAIPTNSPSDGERPATSYATRQLGPMMASKPKSLFKPRNDLGSQRPGKVCGAAQSGRRPQPNGTTRSEYGYFPNYSRASGDGFERDEIAPPPKRTKLSETRAQRVLPKAHAEVVDVSDDDSQPVIVSSKATGVNGKRMSPPSRTQRTNSQTEQIEFFKPLEQRGIDEHLRPGRRKPRRKPRNGTEGEEFSSRSSFSRQDSSASNGHEVPRPGSRQHPQSVIDDETSRHHPLPNTERPQPDRPSSSSTGLPKIDLGKGLDEIQPGKDKVSMDKANSFLARHVNSSSKLKERAAITAANSKQAERPPQPPNTNGDSNLRGKFVRDTSAPLQRQQKTKMRQGMQERSHEKPRVSRHDVSGSPDQLLGETNVGSRNAAQVPLSPEVEATPSRNAMSPTDPQHARFAMPKIRTSKSSPVRSQEDPASESVRCHIKRIYSRGCVLAQTNACLVWDKDASGFYIEEGGSSQRLPAKAELAAIGISEVTAWQWNTASPKVVIKGPLTDCSNGTILIEFGDQQSLKDCMDQLLEASTTMRVEPQTKERIESIFNKQAPLVRDEAKKYAQKAFSDAEQAGLQAITRNQAKRPTHTEVAIVYEGEEVDDTQSKPATSRVFKSPYFTADTAPRRSTRDRKPVKTISPTPEPERWTRIHKPQPWSQSVLFPAEGVRRVTVDFQDLERLDEGEFLNDNVVGYAMRKIEDSMSPEVKSQVHFFNTFFFSSLTSGRGRSINYEAVKKWTKQKDLFDTPYVVVPINANLHWYVAIICNLPNIQRKPVAFEATDSSAAATPNKTASPAQRSSPPQETIIVDSQDAQANEKSENEAMKALSISDGEKPSADSESFTFGEDGHVVESDHDVQARETSARPSGKAAKKAKKKPPMRGYDPQAPAIIMLDSFGTSRAPETRQLKQYLIAEADAKRGMHVEIDQIQGLTAKGIPEQTNMHDCGVYLVGYVEQFAKDPRKFVEKVLTRNHDWESEFAAFKPSDKRAELRDELLALAQEQDEAKKEARRQRKSQKSAATGQSTATTSAAPAPPSSSAPAQPAEPVSKASSPAPAPPAKKLVWQPLETSGQLASSASPKEGGVLASESVLPTQSAGIAREESQGDELESAPPRALPQPDVGNRATSSEELSGSHSRGNEAAHQSSSDEESMLNLNTAHNVDSGLLNGLDNALSAGFSPRPQSQPAGSSS